MIVTDLRHATEQIVASPNMIRALDFLRQLAPDIPDGRVEIDGEAVFALVQSYETSAAGDTIVLEAHRKYIDVQYIVTGNEAIGWASTNRLPVTTEYDEAKEAWFGALPALATTLVHLSAGDVAVFYPEDGHAPRLAAGVPAAVKKIVVKVAVED